MHADSDVNLRHVALTAPLDHLVQSPRLDQLELGGGLGLLIVHLQTAALLTNLYKALVELEA